jgi:DNA adenine methylase
MKLDNEIQRENNIVRPLLRWAGGKSWLLDYIEKLVPKMFVNYHEPFLGGGSVFFHIQPKGLVYLSDINENLISMYCNVRDYPELVYDIFKKFKNTEQDYYYIREFIFQSPIERAAQFIYLNRTCFNGLYRVNQKGHFNVPYGFLHNKELFGLDKFQSASLALKNADIRCVDFEETLESISTNDLVFLDPPYTVCHSKNGFIEYNEKLFAWHDQIRLCEYIKKIKERNAYFILTNAMHNAIKLVFGEIAEPIIVSRNSTIAGKSIFRRPIQEFLFTNVPNLKR